MQASVVLELGEAGTKLLSTKITTFARHCQPSVFVAELALVAKTVEA